MSVCSPLVFRRWILSALFVTCAACGPSEALSGEESLGTEESGIVSGKVARGDPAVVAVTVGGTPFCTGTLVAPSTVVTAAHCVEAFGSRAPYYVFFGTTVDTRRTSQFVPVAAQYRHPSYRGGPDGTDIAVLRLASPVTSVTPVQINTQSLDASDVGTSVRHVGFGVTSAMSSASGTKREVTYNVRQVAAAQIESGIDGKQTCGGDSGGPAFMVTTGSSSERLAGVVSYGDQWCRYFGVDTRVDVHAAWLQQTWSAWEP